MHSADKDAKVLEQISSLFDGQSMPQGRFSDRADFAQERAHMNNWSVIGAALRDELPSQVDLNFADRIAKEIEKIGPVARSQDLLEDQALVNQKPKINFVAKLHKVGVIISEVAAAAAVAAVTIVGWQTYNAGSIGSIVEPAANVTMGTIGGVNLASFQGEGRDIVINMNGLDQSEDQAQQSVHNTQALREARQREIEKVNAYLRGYVTDSAAR